MGFNFATAKAMARRVVQNTLGVPAFYQDASLDVPVELRARWHNRIERFGDDERQGYAEIIEGIERIILIPEIWTPIAGTNPVVTENSGVLQELTKHGIITFPDYGMSFNLVFREPNDGPLEEAWQVTRVA